MQEIHKVQNFLGVGNMFVASPQTSKIHTKTIEESLENYAEVAAELRGSSLEWMLTREVP